MVLTSSQTLLATLACCVWCGCSSIDSTSKQESSQPAPPVSASPTSTKDVTQVALQESTSNKKTDVLTESAKPVRKTRTLDELFLFFPAKHPVGEWNPEQLKFEDVWFEAADGTRLHGWFCPCEQPRGVVLFAHGNAGNLSHRAERLVEMQSAQQLSVLIFDYRGYGRSDGKPTVPGVLQDARAALSLLAKKAGVKAADVILLGRSLGGAVMTQLAAETQPKALVIESSFSSLKEMARHHYKSLAWLVPEKKLNSASAIIRFKGPLLQSHGTVDRVIPIQSGRKLHQAANEPKKFIAIQGGGHNDELTPAYRDELVQFIDSLPK